MANNLPDHCSVDKLKAGVLAKPGIDFFETYNFVIKHKYHYIR